MSWMGGILAKSRPLATVFANERRSRETTTAARGEAVRSTGYVTLAVVDSIKERCLQWIGRGKKLALIITLILIKF